MLELIFIKNNNIQTHKIMDCLFLKLIVSDNSTKKSEITYIEPALIPVRSQNKIKKLE
jgi:hypothetical protein